jgi:thymidine phosphorylase
VVSRVEPRTIGHAVVALGGGRRQTTDRVDPAVGFVIRVNPGDAVQAGQPIGTVHARDDDGAALGLRAMADAITIGAEAEVTPLISHRVSRDGVERLA